MPLNKVKYPYPNDTLLINQADINTLDINNLTVASLTSRTSITSPTLSATTLHATNALANGTWTIKTSTPGLTSGERSSLTMYGTFFDYQLDTAPRRIADIIAGYSTGTWGTEYLSFNVGTGGANDAALVTTERMRIDGSGTVTIAGNLIVNGTTTTIGAATGTTTINSPTFTLPNATTINVNGVSPTFSSTSTGTLTLFNTNILTVNEYGAATSINIGSSAGTATFNGQLFSGSAITAGQFGVLSGSATRNTIIARTANPTTTATITNAVQSAGTVTYTATNTFTAGQRVTITGIVPTTYNVTNATIATATGTNFTISNGSLGGTYASGGTATYLPNNQEWQDYLGAGKLAIDQSGNVVSKTTELVMENTGDTYGITQLRLQNRNGQNGPMFDTSRSTVDLVDFGFQSITTKGLMRLESRVLGNNTVTPAAEFQFGGGGNVFGGTGLSAAMSAFPLVVGVGFYNRGVQINSSGSAIVPLTIRSMPTATATITGATVTTFANQTGTLIIPQGAAVTHSRITGLASTTGLLAGMTLTYVSGAGTFGGGTATILSVDTPTSITINTTATAVGGSITYSIQNAVTYTATNTFSTTQLVTITGATAGTLNVTNATIGSANGTTFTIINTTASGTWSSGGTATVTQTSSLTSWTNPAGTSILSVDSTGNLVTGLTTLNVFNTTATTVNEYGAATAINMGATTGTLTINNPTVVGSQTTQSLFNTVATTLNIGGAATAVAIGASTGTTTIANATVTLSNATTLNINGANPTIASTATGTLTLFNTGLTTVNAFGAATTSTILPAVTTFTLGGTPTTALTATLFGNATTTGITKAISIGTAGASGSITTINIGSTVSGALGNINLGQRLVVRTGTATTGTEPIAFTAGTLLTTPASGSLETGTSNALYYTSASNVRAAVNMTNSVPTAKTANYTMTDGDNVIVFNSASVMTLTLLSAASYPGRTVWIKSISTGTVISASSNVYPRTTATLGNAICSATAGSWAMLVSDGTNWVTMAGA